MVIGSMSTDFVVTSEIIPAEGETVIGESFKTFFGGKGANQAIASCRAGVETFMLGAVGDDVFGQKIIQNLNDQGVNTEMMQVIENMESGSAHIQIKDGDNRIIVVPSSNYELSSERIKSNLDAMEKMDMLVLQNEIPYETIQFVIKKGAEMNVPVLLNPAPALTLTQTEIEKVDYLTPNDKEFAIMFPEQDLETVLAKYPNKLIVTLGDEGAIYHDGAKVVQIPARKVSSEKVVDTTGAGDTFNGYFAAAIVEGRSMIEAIQFANHAASLSIQAHGAQQGIPKREDLE